MESHGTYASLTIVGSGEEVYSPELAKHDYLVLASDVQKNLARLAHTSGFHIQSKRDAVIGNSQVVTKSGVGQCPSTEVALQAATQARDQRRQKIQAKVYFVRSGGMQWPRMIPSPKFRYQKYPPDAVPSTGTLSQRAVLSLVVDIDGKVSQVKVVESAKDGLDQKAIEKVEMYHFEPARKYGLPVPFLLSIAIDFHLHRR